MRNAIGSSKNMLTPVVNRGPFAKFINRRNALKHKPPGPVPQKNTGTTEKK
jgi:hypothetical protein